MRYSDGTLLIRNSFFVLCTLQKLFSTCARVPEIEGYLHFKDFSKKSWSKKFFFLRGSGLYCSTKGKSKVDGVRDSLCGICGEHGWRSG